MKHFRIGGKGEGERTQGKVAGYAKEAIERECSRLWIDRAISTRENPEELDRLTWIG